MSGHLDQLLLGIADAQLAAQPAAARMVVSGLSLDSRQVGRGQAFVALRGTHGHGAAYADGAVERGAVVVLAEAPALELPAIGVPVVWIDHLHAHLGEIAARFYDRPAEALRIVGVTGTNGKTSTVQLLAQALTALGHRTATIGTLGTGLHGHLTAGARTTPDAISVHRLLAEFRAAGATHVAMEVSSHALDQGRVGAVDFEVAAFTNLTRDHLDYHKTMEAYGAAKAKLFAWPGLRAAAINGDDAFGVQLLERLAPDVRALRLSASGEAAAEIAAEGVVTSAEGLAFSLRTPWGRHSVRSHLIGRFNVANLITVAACLGALDEPFDRVVQVLQGLEPVNGRMSRLGGHHGLPLVVVDYAHTPDALDKVLHAVRAHCAGQLICVFGCGGERDAGKRPLMGALAARLADVSIVTDDNPRGEDGDAIVAQIVAGMADGHPYTVERDRAAAIAGAIAQAGPSDAVVIAGKGHETYQEGATGKHPFDDQLVARAALERRA
ncbi:MAG: UDP-N-acetylmuramoyl-L-alanyl-D-glutamate--2,6-diaminopimelate ligase [Rhodanobacter sp.]|nr:MAG: UDP-N-acetylmuramoyl-L-alanyl-D-glutamate--2,6-diaminopimelate ligase [Rhodanobacter sp.]TAM15046.1 MAG: UDP-N-acetylmuramoyl-L-alanyl-D-glutamate--2,6-diaminopimelate ligase [Rhodanobacter sp.]TAM36484.1 MAG: UDP-N-acetylmuramoyl-L-alanyl-D-glutamate--2,6-diaminopimelate ligase [Rhodanobacter sp.]